MLRLLQEAVLLLSHLQEPLIEALLQLPHASAAPAATPAAAGTDDTDQRQVEMVLAKESNNAVIAASVTS